MQNVSGGSGRKLGVVGIAQVAILNANGGRFMIGDACLMR